MQEKALLSQIVNPVLSPQLQTMSGASFFSGLVRTGISIALVVGGIAFLFYFLYGGVLWIMSEGDKSKLTQARSTLIQAMLGILILFSAWVIIAFLENVFEINITEFDLSTLRIAP
jgi:hypothetical protein